MHFSKFRTNRALVLALSRSLTWKTSQYITSHHSFHHLVTTQQLLIKVVVCCAGCIGTNECGVLCTVRIAKAVRSATLSYRLKFDVDYDWTRGGKLPGMCDEDCPTGCVVRPVDGRWFEHVNFRPGGDLTSYMYLPGDNTNTTCGRELFWGV